MKQIDLDPREYRPAEPATKNPHAIWFAVGIIGAIAATVWARELGRDYTNLLLFISAFVAGKSYARWSAGSEPVFFPGTGKRALFHIGIFIGVTALGFLLQLIFGGLIQQIAAAISNTILSSS